MLIEAQSNEPNLNVCDDVTGNNVLHLAVLGGNMEIVRAVLAKSSTILLAKNKEGKTPHDLAKEKKWKGCMKLLGEYKSKMETSEQIVPNEEVINVKEDIKDSSEKTVASTIDRKNKDTVEDKESTKKRSRSYKLCWCCSAKDEKLYKCSGCKKAYYCSKSCIEQDWSVHGPWCLRRQEKNKQ